jgi:hypothetical protein
MPISSTGRPLPAIGRAAGIDAESLLDVVFIGAAGLAFSSTISDQGRDLYCVNEGDRRSSISDCCHNSLQ